MQSNEGPGMAPRDWEVVLWGEHLELLVVVSFCSCSNSSICPLCKLRSTSSISVSSSGAEGRIEKFKYRIRVNFGENYLEQQPAFPFFQSLCLSYVGEGDGVKDFHTWVRVRSVEVSLTFIAGIYVYIYVPTLIARC